jgi:hypothetical protein
LWARSVIRRHYIDLKKIKYRILEPFEEGAHAHQKGDRQLEVSSCSIGGVAPTGQKSTKEVSLRNWKGELFYQMSNIECV